MDGENRPVSRCEWTYESLMETCNRFLKDAIPALREVRFDRTRSGDIILSQLRWQRGFFRPLQPDIPVWMQGAFCRFQELIRDGRESNDNRENGITSNR